tara:strand:- start:845 stop:1147 length:303 start_codon:yes stop_codon:yes gene_type:complete
MTKAKDLEELIEEALGNIRADRRVATDFLNEIATLIANDSENNRSLSPVAAKHVETLQRSNEQLVKLISLCQKNKTQSNVLTSEDKQNLFDMIQEVGENG